MNTKAANHWTFKELMSLPHRDWQLHSTYSSVLIISTRKVHDSGYAMMAIIGCQKSIPIEIAATCCDDIEWTIPWLGHQYSDNHRSGQFRTDCMIKSGALHIWANYADFTVSHALSSVTITVNKKEPT